MLLLLLMITPPRSVSDPCLRIMISFSPLPPCGVNMGLLTAMWMLLLLAGRRNVEAVRELKVSSKLESPQCICRRLYNVWRTIHLAFYDHDATMIRWANHHVYSAFR
jgi:hypothetical protein